MNPVPDIYRILPEVVLTVTGVLVMLTDASLAPTRSRRGLGWVAAIGTTVALWTSLWQLSLPAGTGFSETVETSQFTVFFHVLICGIVLVTLLLSLDTLPADSHHQGEYYALIPFGAVGMCLMTSAVELLVVFIALEISSISTYILAGYRKQTGKGPEAAIKYFLLGLLRHRVPALWNCTRLRSHRNHIRLRNRPQCGHRTKSGAHSSAALAMMLVGILFKVSAAPFHVWTPDVYEGAPSPVVALMSTAPKAAAFAFLLRVVYEMFPTSACGLVAGALGRRRSLHDRRQPGRTAPAEREAHAGLLFIAHAGYLLAAFAGFGTTGIAAASLLHSSLRGNERGHFRSSNACRRL